MAACKHGTVRCMRIPAGICVGGAQNARNDAATKQDQPIGQQISRSAASRSCRNQQATRDSSVREKFDGITS